MRQWVLENTTVTKEEYDNLINCNVLNRIVDKSDKKKEKGPTTLEHPITNIKVFTLKKPTKLRCIFFKIKKEKDYYLYKDVKFKVLAESIPSFKELYSPKRFGKCFQSSIDICYNIENSKLVTALCKEPTAVNDERFIHAFTTYLKDDGIEVVLDSTFNIIIEKDKYLELLDAKIISEIDREKMINDINYLQQNDIGTKATVAEYLCFPDQIMESIKKCNKSK